MLDSKSHSTAMCRFKAGKLLFCPSTLDPVRLRGLQQCASSNRNRAQSLRTCEMLQQEVDFQCLDNANSWTLLKFKSSLGLYSGVLSSFCLWRAVEKNTSTCYRFLILLSVICTFSLLVSGHVYVSEICSAETAACHITNWRTILWMAHSIAQDVN